MAGPIYNPGQPYMLQIPGGFSPGRIAHITGTFTPTATSFILKFQSGPAGDPTDEIGLCMYGRVAEGIIGRNAFTRAAGWGQEEATNSIALARGQNFDVTILCDPMQFQIAINGQHFAEFNHRTNPATLTYVNVASTAQDMTLACLWIEDPAPVAPPTQAPYAQAPVGGAPFPPSPNYGAPPPYSGGPGYAPPPGQPMYQQPPGQYGPPPPQQQHSGSGGKGLLGMVAGAGTAVAGALGVGHLAGKAAKHSGGYPSPGGYPGQYGGYPGHHGGGGGGGMLNKAMGLGGGLATAKMMSKGPGGGGGLMKYAAPVAGLGALGAGGYMLSQGMGHGFHMGHGSSSSSCSSEEEEE